MLAYVFWHWPHPGTDAATYKGAHTRFHRALTSSSPQGFKGSRIFEVAGVPGVPQEGVLFEDWYFLADFASLGTLKEAATAPGVKLSHDEAARRSAGGAAGLYELRTPRVESPRLAAWFSKPERTSYSAFFSRIPAGIELWQRQLVLGPTPEFCGIARRTHEVDMLALALGGIARVSLGAIKV
jgi:hypothetical protein